MANESPLVSVIIPTYKRPDVLPRAVRSVLAQTHKNVEVVVVDDGSGDDTEKVVKTIPDSRVKFVAHTRNKGVAAARNTGLRAARGDFITFLDDDDEYLPGKIANHVRLMAGSSAETGFVCCGFIRKSSGTAGEIKEIHRSFPLFVLLGQILHLPQMLIRKECFAAVGPFDENFIVGSDGEMIYRLTRQFVYRKDDSPLFIYYDTPGSLSSDRESGWKYYYLFFEKHKNTIPAKYRAYFFRLMAKDYLTSGRQRGKAADLLKGYQTLFLAFKSYPLYPCTALKILRYIPVFLFYTFKGNFEWANKTIRW